MIPLLWGWSCVAALAVQVQLRAEPTELRTGQTGSVRLMVVSGNRDGTVATTRPPTLKTGDGLLSSFVGQSQQFENMGGRITRIVQFEYRVAAVEAGSWPVGPVEVLFDDGSRATADPVQIRVTERADAGTVEDFRVSAAFEETEVWEGQTVVFGTRFETRLPGAQVRWRLPTFDGLRSPQHGMPADNAFTVDDPDGMITVRRTFVPLVAVATGARDQGIAVAEVSIPVGREDLFGFRHSRVEQAVSERLKLNVRALPPPPPNFSGLVGDFTVKSKLELGKRADRRSSSKVAVGQSIPWSVVISGDGVIEGFDLPSFAAEGASFYDNGSDLSARMDGEHLRSTAAFRRVVVPTTEGTLALPPFELVTFSPRKGDYVTTRIELPKLTVVPGREGDGTVERYGDPNSEEEADPVAVDLRPIYTWGVSIAPSLGPVLPPLLVLAGAPGALVLGGMGLGRAAEAYRRRRAARHRAPPSAADALVRLPSAPVERLVAFDVALRRLEPRLAAIGDPERRSELSQQLGSLRTRLGRARFGDGTVDDAIERDLRALIAAVEGA